MMNPTQERYLKVTPLDIRQTSFKSAMRGFKRDEVTPVLLEVANDYENALRENDRLRQELVRLDAALKAFDDTRETANLEGARIVRDAESRTEIMLQKAQARLEDIQREIDRLKLKRREAETSIEATISSLHHTLEFVREEEDRRRPVAPTEDAPINGHRPEASSGTPTADAVKTQEYSQISAISTTAESAAAMIAAARNEEVRRRHAPPRSARQCTVAGPESGVQETTDGVAALDKPKPSWLRSKGDAPEEFLFRAAAGNEKVAGPESGVQETTDGVAALDKPKPSWLRSGVDVPEEFLFLAAAGNGGSR